MLFLQTFKYLNAFYLEMIRKNKDKLKELFDEFDAEYNEESDLPISEKKTKEKKNMK
jgi:hypothetical protein